MGCCQSDLKGEKQADVTAEAPQPMKKVATNFSTIDYDSGASNRRDTVYAPDEAEKKQRSHELPAVAENGGPSDSVDESVPITDRNKSAVSPKTSRVPDPNFVEGGETREPYKDIEGASPTSPTQLFPPSNTTATTTTTTTTAAAAPEVTSAQIHSHTPEDMGLFSKSKPTADEPIMNGTAEDKKEFSNSVYSADDSASATETGQVKEKKSLYRKYQDLKRGPGTSALSDEELLKYTGKTREELSTWSKTAPGVAGNQRAGSLTAGGSSGLGVADGAGQGLGGWGWKGDKNPVIH